MDISRGETIFLPVNQKQIIHPYSDQARFSAIALPCYCLEEIIAEKFCAVGGQRRFAISRDLYDIYNLVSFGIDMKAVKQILPEKFKVRGLSLQGVDAKILEQRSFEFEKDWERRLKYLTINKGLHFEEVWKCVLGLLDDIHKNS